MATITHDDLTVCTACALAIANGPCDGCESCAFADGEDCPNTAAERQQDKWGPYVCTGLTLSGEGEDGGRIEYATSPCDGCGRTDAGERHPAVMFKRDDVTALFNSNRVTAEDVALYGRHNDLHLRPGTEIITDEDGFHSIDGMGAGDWLDALLSD